MNKERELQLHLAMMRDVVEMQAIYEAAAKGKPAAVACSEVIGGHFKLTPIVAKGVSQYVSN